MMTYHSKEYKKNTLGSLIRFYKSLLKKGVVRKKGSAYQRMLQLQLRYDKGTK